MIPESPFQTFKRLWKRAPIWRLCGMSAAVFTLMFVLFFNRTTPQPASTSASTAGQASYQPEPVSKPSNDVSSAVAPPVANAASVAGPPSAVVPSKPAVPPKPQTANLSLATPGNASGKAGDLDNALGGRSYSGSVNVDGYKVPLPAGSWVILSNAHYKSPHATGELVFLGQVKNKRLVGGARITALHTAGSAGEGFPPKLSGCSEANHIDLYVVPEAMDANGHQSCWLINSFFTPPLQQWADRATKIDVLDRAAGGDLAAKGVTYPQDFVRIRMTRTESWGVLEVAYLFSPDTAGIKSNEAISAADTDWAHTNISRYPEKLAYVDKMKQWATQFWPGFKSGFDTGAPR
jgi:hypothetical protein